MTLDYWLAVLASVLLWALVGAGVLAARSGIAQRGRGR